MNVRKRILFPQPTTNLAFTIIELLISISIISILIGVSFAGYAKLNQRQSLISSGQDLKNIIRDAQSRVISNEIDCTLCDCTSSGNTSYNGWSVDFTNKRIFGSCGVTPTIFFAKSFNLSSNIIITPYITPASELIFKNNPPNASSKGTICVSHSQLSSTYYVIRVKDTGTISDDGGLASSCTP